jgi:glycosyltransferase involved in cell wall biosynthesis
MPTSSLQLTVSVPTYNRAETLRKTIAHLADQDLDPDSYEVVIVDDGSGDNTREVVESLRSQVPFSLHYHHHPNRGIGATQNCGIRAAKAPIVLMIADDILLTRHALRAHLESHRAHPDEETAVLGNVHQSPEMCQTAFLRTWDLFRFADFEGMSEIPYYRFWAANISAKRDFLLRGGLFRENLGRGGAAAHEDSEFGCRLRKIGLRIFHNPAALGYHYHVVSRDKACLRAYEQGLNFDEFRSVARVPELSVAYHDLRWTTLGDHLRAWFGPNRRHLSPADRNPVIAIGRNAARRIVFNGATVRLIWDPLFDRAERHPRVEALMRPAFYRGLIAYHFFRGVRDGNRRFGLPHPQSA